MSKQQRQEGADPTGKQGFQIPNKKSMRGWRYRLEPFDWRIIDARGRPVPCRGPAAIQAASKTGAWDAKLIVRWMMVPKWSMRLGGVSGLGLFVSVMLLLVGAIDWRSLLVASTSMIGVVLAGAGVWIHIVQIRRSKSIALRRFGICVSCGYPLRGAIATESGDLVCPECGSTWSRDDMVRRASLGSLEKRPNRRGVERIAARVWKRAERRADDRGQDAPIVTRMFIIERSIFDSDQRRSLRRIAGQLEKAGRWRRIRLAVLSILLGVSLYLAVMLLTVRLLTVVSPPGQYDVIILWIFRGVVYGGFTTMAVVLILTGDRGTNVKALVESMKEAGLCASCAHSLEESDIATDGCTVCPECGAAWRIEAGRPGPSAQG